MGYFRTQIFKGNDAKRKADIKRIQVAVEEYEKDNDCYPPKPPDTIDMMSCDPGTGLSPYLGKIPCDPVTKESYYYQPSPGSCPPWYMIYARLENKKDSDIIYGIGQGGVYNYVVGSPNAPLPTPGPTPTGGSGPTTYWGCKSSICVQLSGRTECIPNYTVSTCSYQCGTPQQPLHECIPL